MTEGPADIDRALGTLDYLMGLVEADAYARQTPRAAGAALPVTVIAGFLGAGKTTLLTRLLTAPHGLRIAALVNDLASLNIDAALVEDAGADALTLANGCVCCSLAGGVARALLDLSRLPAAPDCVLLEASGAADPAALAGVVDGLDGVDLEMVTVVIDAAAPRPTPALAVADLVLINKTDLVTPDAAARLEADVLRLAPKAAVLRTRDCAVPPSLILDPDMRVGSAAGHLSSSESGIAARALRQSGPLDRMDVEALVETAPSSLYRAKGVIKLEDGPSVLQAVGRRWRWTPAGPEAAKLAGRLVVIGDGDSAETVLAHFAPMFVPEAPMPTPALEPPRF